VQRIAACVRIARDEQDRRVRDAHSNPVIRRIGVQAREVLRVVRRPVLINPYFPEINAVVAEHIEQGAEADDGAEQSGPLGQRRSDQETAI